MYLLLKHSCPQRPSSSVPPNPQAAALDLTPPLGLETRCSISQGGRGWEQEADGIDSYSLHGSSSSPAGWQGLWGEVSDPPLAGGWEQEAREVSRVAFSSPSPL